MAKKSIQATTERVMINGITDLSQDSKSKRFNPNAKIGKKTPMERVEINGITAPETKGSRFSAGGKA
jgi:hypothetical protein